VLFLEQQMPLMWSKSIYVALLHNHRIVIYHRTALGATETVKWVYCASLMDALAEIQSKEYAVCVVEQAVQTTFLQNVDKLEAKGFALVFGNEVDGVDQRALDLADHIIEIPQFGTKHSLNVSVCAGIVLWEFAKKYFNTDLSI